VGLPLRRFFPCRRPSRPCINCSNRGFLRAHFPFERRHARTLISLTTVIRPGPAACPPLRTRLSIIRSTRICVSDTSSTFLTHATKRNVQHFGTPGPTWAVSPSIACLPQMIRSTLPSVLMALASVYDVAHVSDPAKSPVGDQICFVCAHCNGAFERFLCLRRPHGNHFDDAGAQPLLAHNK